MLLFDRTPSWRNLLLIVCSAALLGPGISANAAAPSQHIKNVKSGRCIGVDHASRSPGAYVKQFRCDGKRNQQWVPDNKGMDGKGNFIVEFRNAKSDMCMGVDHASMSDGANIRQFPCDDSKNQRWRVKVTPTHVTYENLKSSKCIGVDHASMDNGAQLKQFACDGKRNQRWRPKPESEQPRPSPSPGPRPSPSPGPPPTPPR